MAESQKTLQQVVFEVVPLSPQPNESSAVSDGAVGSHKKVKEDEASGLVLGFLVKTGQCAAIGLYQCFRVGLVQFTPLCRSLRHADFESHTGSHQAFG